MQRLHSHFIVISGSTQLHEHARCLSIIICHARGDIIDKSIQLPHPLPILNFMAVFLQCSVRLCFFPWHHCQRKQPVTGRTSFFSLSLFKYNRYIQNATASPSPLLLRPQPIYLLYINTMFVMLMPACILSPKRRITYFAVMKRDFFNRIPFPAGGPLGSALTTPHVPAVQFGKPPHRLQTLWTRELCTLNSLFAVLCLYCIA